MAQSVSFPLQSIGAKEVPLVSGDDSVSDDSLEDYRQSVVSDITNTTASCDAAFYEDIDLYMSKVNSASLSVRRAKAVEILRFEPSFKFTSDTLRKRVIQEVLFPFYRPQYGSTCNWAFTNYHTLNFFDTDETDPIPFKARIPSSSVLMYPSPHKASMGWNQQRYRPTGSFSFEFYINPRYSTFERGGVFKAGTIFHMSSSFSLSLVSGSSTDPNGYLDGYRLLLQLSHSADIPPSQIRVGSSEYSAKAGHLIFSSSNNSLKKNKWHYCCVRWGRHDQNSTGSFFIDGENQGEFLIKNTFLTASGLTQSGSWLQATSFPPIPTGPGATLEQGRTGYP